MYFGKIFLIVTKGRCCLCFFCRYYVSSDAIGAVLAAIGALLLHGPGPNYAPHFRGERHNDPEHLGETML